MSKEMVQMPDLSNYKMKNDRFRQARDGRSEVLGISCSNCSEPVMVYQKDGSGALIRCYLDRIAWPPNLSRLQEETELRELPNLACSSCDTVIGTPMVYREENRFAYRLIRGTFSKKVYKPESTT
ncbi:hypothetical protein A3J20_02725 [Candidatus Gottesmanbacteria bacterium RIFCSPLOWO2_02_FULL_42_29]|uniref:Uncharacterized protein n=1 Tax=Candidatus Gottesmanbacteria bacterium GW2011_GWA2_42_18 TaxID=1618442 RepID=A0A0G1CAN3_9BACT|nr:MAG: hypothetical protein UV09_C0014G0003 [Candidatus Gottesmanbacteria bacterium GW2011_GWA2_42_18]KKS73995.1 MAG: hypothetical protein UV46_C0055G0004 [Candidatus Gottesmanbacteria bacterium GW2011_GWC2_42_8]OGG12115.1 MAG: hypothetical protein A2781_03555 [Candidatus Gottesmanbacteria bacterium RIFCSPHIGHO2_01_FULL_42_27]OGG22036.1 MAG: hypothetical protein A3E72_00900 [Candidatus Gottesmanbacteria bacterium RIFCSPHIGHO2_12_FULL_43_26]OGG35639.1 MAG: hypothetical protein A3G68_05550 [Cand